MAALSPQKNTRHSCCHASAVELPHFPSSRGAAIPSKEPHQLGLFPGLYRNELLPENTLFPLYLNGLLPPRTNWTSSFQNNLQVGFPPSNDTLTPSVGTSNAELGPPFRKIETGKKTFPVTAQANSQGPASPSVKSHHVNPHSFHRKRGDLPSTWFAESQYVFLSSFNLYSSAGRFERPLSVEDEIPDKGVRKNLSVAENRFLLSVVLACSLSFVVVWRRLAGEIRGN